MNEPSAFMRALFGSVPAEQWVLLWTLPGKLSHWHKADQLDAAIDLVTAMADSDVYVGVALAPDDLGPRRRCPAINTTGIVGLWADVDYVDDVHKKSNLPPDEEAALGLVRSIGVDPSIVVNSGHGLQAWWLFQEPWVFADDADRSAASELAARWLATLRLRASEQGWALDATQDLARVLRVPGTLNHKSAPATEVRLLELHDDRRYNLDDLEPFLVDPGEWQRLSSRQSYVLGSPLTLVASAWPPPDKLDALVSNDKKFRETWERTRKDLKDDSPSAYDQALATQVAAVGWADQEIADLLIASRRKHGDDMSKALRVDYITRTIVKARDDRARDLSVEEIEGLADRVDRADETGNLIDAHHARRDLVETIATMLGIRCTRFVRFTQDPPRYRMETVTGAITIGMAGAVLSQTQMRAAVAAATNIVIPIYKPSKWHAIAQAIFSACEDEDTGMESTDEGTAYAWLSEYLQDRTILTDRDEAAEQQWPFVDQGVLNVFGPSLRRWLWMTRAERVSASRMGEVLRAFGAEPAVVAAIIRDKRTTRQVWRIRRTDELGVTSAGRAGTIEPGDEEVDDGEVF